MGDTGCRGAEPGQPDGRMPSPNYDGGNSVVFSAARKGDSNQYSMKYLARHWVSGHIHSTPFDWLFVHLVR